MAGDNYGPARRVDALPTVYSVSYNTLCCSTGAFLFHWCPTAFTAVPSLNQFTHSKQVTGESHPRIRRSATRLCFRGFQVKKKVTSRDFNLRGHEHRRPPTRSL